MPRGCVVVVPEGHTRCSRVNGKRNDNVFVCQHVFPNEWKIVKDQSVSVKLCPQHRAKGRNDMAKPTAIVNKAVRNKTPKYVKKRRKQHNEYAKTDKSKKKRKEWNDVSPKYRQILRRRHAKMMADPGKRAMELLRIKMWKMMRGVESATVSSRTQFGSSEVLCAHLESTFPEDGSMTFGNAGRKGVDLTEDDRKHRRWWELGHRIARAHYNGTINEDMQRCWTAANIFAQWSIENNQLKTKLPPSSMLLKLRSYWPTAWNDTLPDAAECVRLERLANKGLLG